MTTIEPQRIIPLHTVKTMARIRPQVALLHSLALDHTIWDPVVRLLAQFVDVTTIDLPGHGRSPKPLEPTMFAIADQVADALRTHTSSPLILVGMSLGGSAAQAVAYRHPDLIAGLVLFDTTPWYGPTAKEDWENRYTTAAVDGFESMAEFQLTRWFSEDFRTSHADECRKLIELFASNDLDSYRAVCSAMGDMDLRATLSEIAIPVRVIVGAEDTATPVEHARLIADSIPGADLVIVPASRHLTAIERPSRAMHEILTLVERVVSVARYP